MQVRNMLVGVVASACLAIAPAYAGPQGHHAVLQPPARGKPPAPPVPHAKPPAPPAAPGHPSTPAAASHEGHEEHAEHAQASVKPAPFVKRIESHPELVSRLQPLVPPGMTLQMAAAGFKNQGQFIAALHVSHNLGIPFAQLKAEMVRPDHDSLGQAIQDLRPGVNAKVAARRAENEAKEDLKFAKVKATREKNRDDR